MKSAAPVSHSKTVRPSRRFYSILHWCWQAIPVALTCSWRCAHRICTGIIGVIGWLRRAGSHIGAWLAFHIGAPALCFVCIYLGVMSTLALPAALWSGLLPAVFPRLGVPVLSDFPIASLPDPASISSALLTAIPLALAVFKRHHQNWCISPDPLLARMLFAAYAGVSWPSAWFSS